MSTATTPAVGNIIDQVDLANLPAGSIVEFATGSGSTYWITTTRMTKTTVSELVTGVGFQTSSRTYGRMTLSPERTNVDRHVIVGQRFRVPGGRTTNLVTSIKLLA